MNLTSENLTLIGLGVTLLGMVWNAARKVESVQKDVTTLIGAVHRLSGLSERVAKLEAVHKLSPVAPPARPRKRTK